MSSRARFGLATMSVSSATSMMPPFLPSSSSAFLTEGVSVANGGMHRKHAPELALTVVRGLGRVLATQRVVIVTRHRVPSFRRARESHRHAMGAPLLSGSGILSKKKPDSDEFRVNRRRSRCFVRNLCSQQRNRSKQTGAPWDRAQPAKSRNRVWGECGTGIMLDTVLTISSDGKELR